MHLAGLTFASVGQMVCNVRIRIAESLEIHRHTLHVHTHIGRVHEGPRAYRVQVYPAFQCPGVLFLLFLAVAARGELGNGGKLVRDELGGI
ncbi:hypothetical protein D3C87_1996320 [compost metagenome]